MEAEAHRPWYVDSTQSMVAKTILTVALLGVFGLFPWLYTSGQPALAWVALGLAAAGATVGVIWAVRTWPSS